VAGRGRHSLCAFGGGVFGVAELWGWGGGAAAPGDRPAEEPIFPEKVFFTPRPGLLLPSAWGHLMVWLEEDVLYVLIAEHDSQLEAAIIIAKSLQKIH